MSRTRHLAALLLGITGLLNWNAPPVFTAASLARELSALPEAPPVAQAGVIYARLPMRFEANAGQADGRVRFLSLGGGYTVYLTAAEAVFHLQPSGSRAAKASGHLSRGPQPAVLRMQMVGANPNPRVVGLEELPGKSNYFIGRDPQNWRVGIPNYSRVRYGGVYPGIDMVYYGNQRRLEYDFIVAPGADPNAVNLNFAGAQEILIDDGGDLVLKVAGNEVRQHRPFIYQEADGRRRPVAGGYTLRRGNTVGFALADYDRSKPLIIDPVLSYSAYVDSAADVAVDRAGNIYVTSNASADGRPPLGDNSDVFVMKLNPAGDTVVYSALIGGSGYDAGLSIAPDADGNAYVTGRTSLTNLATPGAFQTTPGGTFVTKLDPEGTSLVYSTYLGKSGTGWAIAVDAAGNAYVAGGAGADFPTTAGAFKTAFSGDKTDAFITKLNPTGSALVYSTYLGGDDYDHARGVAVDAAGSAFVTGATSSTNFPTTAGAFQTAKRGGISEGFITRLNPAGNGLVYSTLLGGTGDDSGYAVDLDADGNVHVTGFTMSTDFPTVSPVQRTTGSGPAFKSGNRGGTWSVANAGLPRTFFYQMAIDPMTPSTLYAASDAGVFKTTNGGDSWRPINAGLPSRFVRQVVIDPRRPSTLYVGLVVNGQNVSGVFRSTDGGESWNPTSLRNTAGPVLAVDAINSFIYASDKGANGPGISRSTDGGLTWSFIPITAPGTSAHYVSALAVDPTDPSTLYAGLTFTQVSSYGKLFKSTDGGRSWAEVVLDGDAVSFIVVAPTSPSRVYVSAYGLLYRSIDGGVRWTPVPLGRGVSSLAIDPADPSVVYVSASGSLGGVLKSTDGGASFRDVGLPGVSVAALAIDPGNPARLYALTDIAPDVFVAKLNATGSALFYSTYLGGSSWDSGAGIAVDAQGNAVVAGRTTSDLFPGVNAARPDSQGGFVAVLRPAQERAAPSIGGVSVIGKRLLVSGENFSDGAVILLDGQPQKTAKDDLNPSSSLIGKKAGKKIPVGQPVVIQVRNSDGALSDGFRFVRPAG